VPGRGIFRTLAAAALLTAACGGEADPSTTEVVAGQALRVASANGLATGTVRLDGDQVARGKNAFLVDFDPSSTEISSASTMMPVHGHGSVTPTLSRSGTSYRLSDVVFNMPGLWEVRLDIAIDGRADRLVFDVDAP
jgi:hypothetical protein